VSYEYRGLKAQSWDLLRGDTSQWPDRAFYLEVIRRSGEPVLDVGCGTGRLLLDYAQQGIDIDGVDNSPEMLDLCRERAQAQGIEVLVYEQTMQALELPRRYRTILVPSSSLQLLIEPEAAREGLRRLAAHLQPGGTLVASMMKLRREGQPLSFDWIPWGKAQRPDGATVRRFMRSSFDEAAGLDRSEERFEVVVGGNVIESEQHPPSLVRAYTLDGSLALFESAGLTSVHATADFTFEPADAGSHIWCVFGTAPDGAS
jgi:ubiquinone/menaquinone biosynthesis C-methylase UbiE